MTKRAPKGEKSPSGGLELLKREEKKGSYREKENRILETTRGGKSIKTFLKRHSDENAD